MKYEVLYDREPLWLPGESASERTYNSMFFEASERTRADIDKLIRQAVKIAHGMKR